MDSVEKKYYKKHRSLDWEKVRKTLKQCKLFGAINIQFLKNFT